MCGCQLAGVGEEHGVLGWLSWVRDSDHDLTVHRTKPHSDSVLSEDSTWTLFLSAPLPTHILLTHINHWRKENSRGKEIGSLWFIGTGVVWILKGRNVKYAQLSQYWNIWAQIMETSVWSNMDFTHPKYSVGRLCKILNRENMWWYLHLGGKVHVSITLGLYSINH